MGYINTDSAVGGMGSGGFGGNGFGFGGGLGGFGLFGLLGLRGIGGLDGEHRHTHGGDNCTREILLMNAIGNLKDSIAASKDAVEGNVDRAKDFLGLGLGRIDDEICETKSKILETKYDLAALNVANTQSIKDQATAFAISNDRKLDELARDGDKNTALILARINQSEVDRLRDELLETRHGLRAKDLDISIQNTNTNIQQQMQQQQQQQIARDFEFHRRFDFIGNQVAKSGQDIINVGGLMAGVAQTANPVNVKS